MRIRTVLSAAVLAALAAFPLAGVASAQPTDRECRDFASQAAAESALRSGSGDPARLDPDGNGVACESYFTMAVPGGPVPDGPVPDRTVPAPGAVPATAPVEPVSDRDPAPGAVVPAPVAPAPLAPGDGAPAAADPADAAPVDAAPVDAVPAAPADPVPAAGAPVRTVPRPQILVKPQGAPDTGDGSTAPLDATPLDATALDATALVLLVGGLGATAVGAVRHPGGRTR